MKIQMMVTDCWSGVSNAETETPEPSLTDIIGAVTRLDGKERTLVTLHSEGDAHMSIGGDGGRFVVYITSDNEVFHTLTGDGDPSAVVTLVAGGQEGEYPGNTVVGKDEMLSAVEHYFSDGEPHPALKWIRE